MTSWPTETHWTDLEMKSLISQTPTESKMHYVARNHSVSCPVVSRGSKYAEWYDTVIDCEMTTWIIYWCLEALSNIVRTSERKSETKHKQIYSKPHTPEYILSTYFMWFNLRKVGSESNGFSWIIASILKRWWYLNFSSWNFHLIVEKHCCETDNSIWINKDMLRQRMQEGK